MQSIKILLLTCLTLVIGVASVKAQKKPLQFGKPSPESVHSNDPVFPEAEAVVIANYGTSFFDKDAGGGLYVKEIRESRVKIQSKAGMRFADIEIYFMRSKQDNGRFIEEQVVGIQGYTHNSENGEIKRFELNKDKIFREKNSDYYGTIKFSLPNVKVGSVIEFKYEVRTPRGLIPQRNPWYFQDVIPVRWSELRMEYPDVLELTPSVRGFEPLHIKEGPTRGTNRSGEFYTVSRRYAAKDLIGFDEQEGFVNKPSDYLTQIEFRITRIAFPGYKTEDFDRTWGQLNRELRGASDFGKFYLNDKFFPEEAFYLTEHISETKEKISLLYDTLRRRVLPDIEPGLRPMESKDLIEKYQKGALAPQEANIVMVRMLKSLGLKSEPVLLSTVNNGKYNISLPNLSDFDYFLCSYQLEEGGKDILLDAADTLLKEGMITTRCLNGKGFFMNEVASTINNKSIIPPSEFKESGVIRVKLNKKNELEADVEYSLDGYAGYLVRKDLLEKEAEEMISENYKEQDFKDNKIEVEEVKGLEQTDEPLILKYKTIFEESVISAGKRLYINPMLIYGYDENPFKLEERKFPVEMPFPINQTFVINIEIPDGYELEEMPQPLNLSLPGNDAQFVYLVEKKGNILKLTSRLMIRKTFYEPQIYKPLKDFFANFTEKQNEQIVLKKVL